MIYQNKYKKARVKDTFISCLLIGTALRIPVSVNATISLAEVLLALSLIFFPIYLKGRTVRLSKFEIKLWPLALLILTLLGIESLIHFNRIASVFLLFEYLFIGILFVFIFNRIGINHRLYYKSLIVFSLYLAINTLYFNVLNYEIGQKLSVLKFGSRNYTSAVMLLIIPIIYLYIKEDIVPKLNILAYLSIFLMIIDIIFSGSRSNIVVLLFQITIYIFFVKNSIIKRVKIIIAIILIGLIAYNIILLINPELSFVIKRYIAFFTGNSNARNDILYSDILRENLKNEAKELISKNRYWGTGFPRLPSSGIPVHNFVYEIILGIGYIGFMVYSVYFIIFIGGIFKRISKESSIQFIMMVITFLSISWVQPFMTTGKEFTLIFWLNVVAFYNYSHKFVKSKNCEIK